MQNTNNLQLKVDTILAFAESDKLPLKIIEEAETSYRVLKELTNKHGNKTFSLLIFSLTHELFSEELSKEYWQAIVKHHQYLTKLMLRSPGITVAALDYMSNIAQCIISPKIISDDKSQLIIDAASKDALTHLYTRKVFDIALEKQCQQACNHGVPVSLIMLDLDDFKSVNDNFGHLCGDHLLTEIGKTIMDCIRDADIPARYGGEELAIIMPRTDIEDALIIAERLRTQIASNKTIGVNITASIGVSVTKHNKSTAESLIKSADCALYVAKRSGKNLVCCEPDEI